MVKMSHESQRVFDLFERLAAEMLAEGGAERESRLWKLPRDVVYYYHNVILDEDKTRLHPLVEKLRRRAVELLSGLPEQAAKKARRAERIRLNSDKFTFRPWRQEDLERFVSYLDDAIMWAHLPEDYPAPLSPDLAASLIEASNEAPQRHEVRAVEWEGDAVGQVRLQFDASVLPDAAEISYWLAQPYWNKGLATNFVTLYTYESFRVRSAIKRIFARVLAGNTPSIRVLEKAGYRPESFEYHNVEKQGQKVSTHVLSVYATDYLAF